MLVHCSNATHPPTSFHLPGFSYKKGSKAVSHFVTQFVHSDVVICPPALTDRTGLAEMVESSNEVFYSAAARVVALYSALATPSKVSMDVE